MARDKATLRMKLRGLYWHFKGRRQRRQNWREADDFIRSIRDEGSTRGG